MRANDSEVPGTPDIYFRMSSGLADVQTNEWELPDGTSFKFSAAERKVVLEAYKQRWDMLYNRLHALGLVLNPLLHSKHKFDGTCMVETRQYIDAYFASESEKAARCHQQLDNFRDKKGESRRWGHVVDVPAPATPSKPDLMVAPPCNHVARAP